MTGDDDRHRLPRKRRAQLAANRAKTPPNGRQLTMIGL
jgi:hypothetical protein